MTLMISGMLLFVLIHLIPAFKPVRSALTGALGENPYKGIFTILSIIGIGLLVSGYRSMSAEVVWQPPAWGRTMTMILVPMALILLAAMHGSSNIKRWVRNPMLWGFMLWSGGHLLSNGNLRDLLLFGTFLVYSLVGMASVEYHGKVKIPPPVPYYKDVVTVGIGLVLTALVAWFHGSLSGIPLHG